MKIKMLKHVNGKVDGVRMGPYILGREYSVPDEIDKERAELFIGSAMAEEVIVEDLLPPITSVEDAHRIGAEAQVIRRNRR